MSQEQAPWRVLHRRYLLQTPWRSFVVERVRTHTGDEIEYSFNESPDAVFVVPLTVDRKLALVRQYRHPVRAWAWEVPAGSFGAEGPAEAARRELAEEVGGAAAKLIKVGEFWATTGHLSHRNHFYLAVGVTLGEHEHEATELMEVALLDPAEALARARSGAIDDGESAFALLLCEPLIRQALEAGASGTSGAD